MSQSPPSQLSDQYATLNIEASGQMMSDDDNEDEFYLPRVPRFLTSDSGDFLSDSEMIQADHNLPFRPIRQEGEEDEEAVDELEHEREDSENEDHKMDDAAKENAAISAYHDTHPEKEQRLLGGREISVNEAVWSVSSFRPHWGPDKLRDNNPLTYWQSDCPNPNLEHTIDLVFDRATLIRQVSFFIDCEQDESYAPKIISIRGGITSRDLQELKEIETDKVVGWVNADITESNDGKPFRVSKLQIAILATHQNGRDTHIRQVKVYSVVPSFAEHQAQREEEEEPTHIGRPRNKNVIR